jgi:transposase
MRPKGTASELERRRRRAVKLLERGEAPAVVARILGVKRTSLHRWRRMAQQMDGLAAKPPSGAKRRLDNARLAELEQLLSQGATAYGFPNELWTAARVAQVILRHFGVKYHPAYVRRLLRRRLNWTSRSGVLGNATTRRWSGGRPTSSPGSCVKPFAATRMSLFWTNPALC